MAAITTVDNEPVDREAEIEVLVSMGIDREFARFLVAISHGEIDGDMQIVEAEAAGA